MIHMLSIGTMLEHKKWVFHIGEESNRRGMVALRLFPLLSNMFVVNDLLTFGNHDIASSISRDEPRCD
jgi:hypothetical protein